MAFGGFDTSSNGAPVAEINMIPLIDVMLVLLVIFIVTAPLLTHAVKIDLPRASSQPNLTRPEHVDLFFDAIVHRQTIGSLEVIHFLLIEFVIWPHPVVESNKCHLLVYIMAAGIH